MCAVAAVTFEDSVSVPQAEVSLSLSLSTRQEGKHGPVQPPARARAPAVHGRVRNILVGGFAPPGSALQRMAAEADRIPQLIRENKAISKSAVEA